MCGCGSFIWVSGLAFGVLLYVRCGGGCCAVVFVVLVAFSFWVIRVFVWMVVS